MDPKKSSHAFADTVIRVAVIGTLSILTLFLYAKTREIIEGFGKVNVAEIATITVNGTATATAIPNIAHVSFTVEEMGVTGEEAQNKATKITNNALTEIKKRGIADKDVQTSGYQVSAQYETKPCVPGGPCTTNTGKIAGYSVSQSVEVKIRDTAKTGEILQALTGLGVQNVSGPDFRVDDATALNTDARAKAIVDAQTKAAVLARQLGVRLGRVVGFLENTGNAYPMMDKGVVKANAMNSVAPAPTLPMGESETTANVSVIFEIR